MDYLDRRRPHVEATHADLEEVFGEQATVVVSAYEQDVGVEDLFDRLRWDTALRDRILIRNRITASDFGRLTAEELDGAFDSADLDAFLTDNAEISADYINTATLEGIQEALAAEAAREALSGVFDDLLGQRTDRYAESMVTTAANFGALKSAEQNDAGSKTWVVNSGNPRSLHAAMNGATVPIDGVFGNGMRWPGDPSGGAKNNANCQCSLTYSRA